MAKKVKESCNFDSTTVLYFFAKSCERCDDQGFVLTYLKTVHKDRILIFALDADLDESSIKTLVSHFNIESYPSLVINDNVYEGFHNRNDLERILNL